MLQDLTKVDSNPIQALEEDFHVALKNCWCQSTLKRQVIVLKQATMGINGDFVPLNLFELEPRWLW